MTTAAERTRALLARRLRLDFAEQRRDGYREQTDSLAGEWLGAFAQPGVILNTASAMRASFTASGGESVDEYGEATFEVFRADATRIELRKEYKRRGLGGCFVYMGRHHDGTLAGYWHSVVSAGVCGVFWMARVDRLADPARLAARVQRRSVRRAIAVGAGPAILGAVGAGAYFYPPALAGILAVSMLSGWSLLAQAEALRREVELWQRELG